MNAPFTITCEWLPPLDTDSNEQATLAELAIDVAGLCATEVVDIFAKTVRPSIWVSAFPLAEWFAANWWRLLWEPQSDTYSWRASHKVGNSGYGYSWPDLSFSSDWQTVLVRSGHTSRLDMDAIRYLNQFDRSVSVADFEQGVANFIEGTLARLSVIQKRQSELAELWQEITEERHNPEAAQWRSLEAGMGYDPDEAPEGLIAGLQEQAKRYGASSVQEMAAASKDQAPSHINGLWEAAQESGVTVQVPSFSDLRRRLKTEGNPGDLPWQRAAQAAQLARETWELDIPVATARLVDLFRVSQKQFEEPGHPAHPGLSAGFRDGGPSDSFSISWNSNHPASRRFTLARLVGDHIATPEQELLLPGTRTATHRQKFQRAFAQEFLCPFAVLKEVLGSEMPDNDDITAAAEHFAVSPLTVQSILVNKGVVDRETFAGWVG